MQDERGRDAMVQRSSFKLNTEGVTWSEVIRSKASDPISIPG